MKEFKTNIDGADVNKDRKQHRELIEQVVRELNIRYTDWNVMVESKPYKFKLYQARDGFNTTFYTRWKYDGAKLYLEGGFYRNDSGEQKCFIELYTVNKSEKINYALQDAAMVETLKRNGYNDISSQEGSPYFTKDLIISDYGKAGLIFTKETDAMRPVVEQILK